MHFAWVRVSDERPDGDERRRRLVLVAPEPDGLGLVDAEVWRVRVEGRVFSGHVEDVLLLDRHLLVLVVELREPVSTSRE